MQDMLDKIVEAHDFRLTPRAKQLLLLIFDGLMNEPIQWNKPGMPLLSLETEWSNRRELINVGLTQLPDLLLSLPQKYIDEQGKEFITLFDLLHQFEAHTRDLQRTAFFGGKLD